MTESQRNAVAAEGNVLVSAGAGSGKTQTLVDRCIDRITRAESPVSIDRILMVTFTNAAAAEMRARIRERLQHLSDQTPENARLQEQLALLDTAAIGTLHGFCLELIREHFHELGIDPLAIVADDAKSASMARQTLDQLLNRRLQQAEETSTPAMELLRGLAGGRLDTVADLVLMVHAYARSLPDPERWQRDQERALESDHPTGWEPLLVTAFVELRETWVPGMEALRQQNLDACARALRNAGPQPDRTQIASALDAVLLEHTRWKRGDTGRYRDPFEKLFEAAGFLRALALPTPSGEDPLREDWRLLREPLGALLALVREFSEGFQQLKRDQGIVDFSDLEQSALDLLWKRSALEPTDLARALSRRFDTVYVDEYQDINRAQDCILQAVGSAEGNRFLVGDVKQSIYRFRRADPQIFQDWLNRWQQPGSGASVIHLRENFRSHESILGFVNEVFSDLMTSERCGLDYAASESLRLGDRENRPFFVHSATSEPRVEVLVFEEEETNDTPEPVLALTKTEAESRVIVEQMVNLHRSETPVWDRGLQTWRRCRWSDFAVLARSGQSYASAMARCCAEAGIPLETERTGFYTELEILDVLNLLRVLDNPLQDIPLAAVLRSPFGGFEVQDLALVRLALRRGPIWHALVRLSESPTAEIESDADLATACGRAKRMVERIERWRGWLQVSALSQGLVQILEETRYLDWTACQPRGVQKLANIRKLLAMTGDFDNLRRQGLFRFLRLMESHERTGHDPGPAAETPGEAVRLMTVHKSKGLQFPIVFLAGASTRFNFMDSTRKVLLSTDPRLGVTCMVKQPGFHPHYPTLPLWIARQHERAQTLNEELRLLYVALTRASDRLILPLPAPSETTSERWAEQAAAKLPHHQWLQSQSYADWLGPVITRLSGASDWMSQPSGAAAWVRWRRCPIPRGSVAVRADDVPLGQEAQHATEALVQRWQSTRWSYPFATATQEPAKSTVSTIRRRWMTSDDEIHQPTTAEASMFPRTRGSHKLTAAEAGIANHTFLEHLNLEASLSIEGLEQERSRLLASGILSEEAALTVDLEALADFWNSETGRHFHEHRAYTHRELPFTAAFSAEELQLKPLPEDDFVVVQGIVDIAIILPEEIHVLDFKTGRVSEADWEAHVRDYSIQLQLYGTALTRIYKRPVTRLWIRFLSLRKTVEVPPRHDLGNSAPEAAA